MLKPNVEGDDTGWWSGHDVLALMNETNVPLKEAPFAMSETKRSLKPGRGPSRSRLTP